MLKDLSKKGFKMMSNAPGMDYTTQELVDEADTGIALQGLVLSVSQSSIKTQLLPILPPRESSQIPNLFPEV